MNHSPSGRQPCSYTAISATTAAKDIWKLAPNRLSGAARRIIAAAQATKRKDNAVRSSITASRTKPVMTNARWVGTVAPVRIM